MKVSGEIRLSPGSGVPDAGRIAEEASKNYGVRPENFSQMRLTRRSIDARRRSDVKILYRFEAELSDGLSLPDGLAEVEKNPAVWHAPEKAEVKNPVIVGTGPAGLFAALVLARAGAEPVVIDRGYDVDRRKTDVEKFFSSRTVDPNSNFLCGEGGAGTWSDGKLFTRVRDERIAFVLDEFIRAGADEKIRYFSHPHVGSDKLPEVIKSVRNSAIASGAKFLWGHNAVSVIVENGRCRGVTLDNGEKIFSPAVVVAAGHSAMPLMKNLMRSGAEYALKGFQIGTRIEHPQSFINLKQFSMASVPDDLGAAEYNLVLHPSEKSPGATTFCMCPGGEIIPAVSEEKRLCTNGMSNAARSGAFANSAIVTTVGKENFSSPDEAFDLLAEIEKNAFACGGGDFTAPAQRAKDFVEGRKGSLPREFSYRLGIVPGRIDELLPDAVREVIRRAIRQFDRIMPSFMEKGCLTGVETRVSSPVRFLRNPVTLASSVKGLYTAGEFAGMAGGITSAAADGIKIAEALCGRTFEGKNK